MSCLWWSSIPEACVLVGGPDGDALSTLPIPVPSPSAVLTASPFLTGIGDKVALHVHFYVGEGGKKGRRGRGDFLVRERKAEFFGNWFCQVHGGDWCVPPLLLFQQFSFVIVPTTGAPPPYSSSLASNMCCHNYMVPFSM